MRGEVKDLVFGRKILVADDNYIVLLQMSFEEYLVSKKIDSASFAKSEPILFQEWKDLFEQLSQKSFTSQKLYLINPIRRRFLLTEVATEKKFETGTPTSKPVSKPIIKPKIN
jgi:hypothetical protein